MPFDKTKAPCIYTEHDNKNQQITTEWYVW